MCEWAGVVSAELELTVFAEDGEEVEEVALSMVTILSRLRELHLGTTERVFQE